MRPLGDLQALSFETFARLRETQRGAGEPPDVEVRRVDEHTFLACGLGGGDAFATRVSFAHGNWLAHGPLTDLLRGRPGCAD